MVCNSCPVTTKPFSYEQYKMLIDLNWRFRTMAYKPKILAFAGSLRKNSFNKRVLKVAIKGAEKTGAEVTYIDLNDFPMPIYNADHHANNGFDENALKLQGLLTQHDGLLIATPSYNGSLSAALKNTIDWTSRPNDTYQKADIYPGKVAAIISASPGSLGGIRALAHLRGVLSSVSVHVLPSEVAVPFVGDRFDGDGMEMVDAQMKETLENLSAALVAMLRKTYCWSDLGSHSRKRE
jgi:NAD(P)H-dependent FMN reductase